MDGIFLLYSILLFFASTRAHCDFSYHVKEGDTCKAIQILNSLNEEEFVALNPSISCEKLSIGQMICLKSAGNETHLLKKSVDSSNDTRPHESHISELRLGHLEIGKVVMDVDLNFEMRRVEMKEVIKKAFTQLNFDPKRPYLEKIGPAYLEEKLKEFRELFSAIAPPMVVLNTSISLNSPDEMKILIKELREMMLDEFTSLKLRVNEVLRRRDLNDFRAHISDKNEDGAYLLQKLWNTDADHNLRAFRDWCTTDPPIQLASSFLDQLNGNTSILDSFKSPQTNEKTFVIIDEWLENLLKWLTITGSSCGALYPVATQKTMKEDFMQVLRAILSKILATREGYRNEWQSSMQTLARSIIDNSPNNNDLIVEKLFTQLKANYTGFFFVSVVDAFKPDLFSDCNSSLAIGGYYRRGMDAQRTLTSEKTTPKNYRIARSSCRQPPAAMASAPGTPMFFEDVLHYYETKHCNTSSMVYLVIREGQNVPLAPWEYSYYRAAYDQCAVQRETLKFGTTTLIENVIVSQ